MVPLNYSTSIAHHDCYSAPPPVSIPQGRRSPPPPPNQGGTATK